MQERAEDFQAVPALPAQGGPPTDADGGGAMSATRTVELRTLASIIAEKREPEWLLHSIIECNVLALLVGPRSTFKSFIALDWSMRVATSGKPVLILSGEGAGLGVRAEAWIKAHNPGLDPEALQIIAQERPLRLSVAKELEALSAKILATKAPPVLIVLDTWSKFAGSLDENSNSEVAAYLSELSRNLRERFGATVLIVAHTGHAESGRARGASALAANTDAEYIVTRARRAMTVSLTRDRFKDTPSLPPLGYEARVMNLDRVDAFGDPVTSLALFRTEAPRVSPTIPSKRTGKNQHSALMALREWTCANPDGVEITSEAIAKLLNAGVIDRRRKSEVLNSLCDASDWFGILEWLYRHEGHRTWRY